MKELAAFASSEDGRLWARTHERFGMDPAGFLEDDVLAYNFRVALLLAGGPERTDDDANARSHRAGVDRSHRASEALKAALHG